jgi:hypothetical protein
MTPRLSKRSVVASSWFPVNSETGRSLTLMISIGRVCGWQVSDDDSSRSRL